MTREEAIKTLKENYCAMCAYGSQDMDSCNIRSCDNKNAIKVLEQEPFMNKPCILYKVCHDDKVKVLDKIRAEIEERAKINQNLNIDRARALCWCLDVIDKYKTESED